MIVIEQESEEETSPRTPTHFGLGLYLYPSFPQLTYATPLEPVYLQAPIDSLGHLLGHLTTVETTSQTVSSVTAATTSTVATSFMFTTTPKSHLYGGSSIPLGYQ